MIYSVRLETCGNPDHGQNPFEPLDGVPSDRVYTASIEECQRRVLEYINKYDIGSGNWYDGLGEYVGKISYNGRFWSKEEEK